jgi:hypothetical protein
MIFFFFCEQCFVCKYLYLRDGVVGDPVLLEYDVASLSYRVPTFRRNIMPSNFRTRSPNNASYPRRVEYIVFIIIIIIINDTDTSFTASTFILPRRFIFHKCCIFSFIHSLSTLCSLDQVPQPVARGQHVPRGAVLHC